MSTLVEQLPTAHEGSILPVSHDSGDQGAKGLSIAAMQHTSCFSVFDLLRRTEGSQLLELALSLPIMIALMIAVADFGQAWNIKQKLANAAREGTRIGASAPTLEYYSSLPCSLPIASSPCSVQAIADSVKQYMVNASLSSASCLTPNSPTSSTTTSWSYTCGGVSMTITWPYTFTATGGGQVMGTQVSLAYPYTWHLNQVIGLLHQNSLSLPSTIGTNSVMPNLN